ncbi:putative protein TPRXL [Panonychus citri]|uniref:putative protein TPRXL n=1 Tax=Panonychus citri TaxID=50023 RepID=UPI002307E93D|nr:putative protein TPRXL [Panonychus citri]
MASVTMSQAPSSYSSNSSSNQSGYSENDITSKFGRIKFSDGPTLIVCDIDNNDACNSSMKRSNEDDSPMMISPSTTISKSVETPIANGTTVKLSSSSSSTHSMKETIERSPSTSSLSVPTVDVDEKRPPLPDENMMIDESL